MPVEGLHHLERSSVGSNPATGSGSYSVMAAQYKHLSRQLVSESNYGSSRSPAYSMLMRVANKSNLDDLRRMPLGYTSEPNNKTARFDSFRNQFRLVPLL
jgi:hypothetical protein